MAFQTLETRLVNMLVHELVNHLLPEIRMIHDDRFRVLDRKLDALLDANRVIMRWIQATSQTIGDEDMSRLHDDLLNLANEVDSAADRVVARATDSETQLQDVITKFEAIRDKLNHAADEDASQGGSTGGGSGSGAPGQVNIEAARR